MKLIFLSLFLLIVLFESIGRHVAGWLLIPRLSFYAPLGFVFFLAVCAMAYYPVLLWHGNFYLLVILTSGLLLFGLYCIFVERKNIRQTLFSKEMLIVILSLCAWIYVFYHCYVDLEFSDAPMYLNNIAQNIGNAHVNLFNLYTGETGQEWDALYLYQAYYPLVSVYVFLLRGAGRLLQNAGMETLKVTVWGMGMLYNVISAMVIVDIVKRFTFLKRWQKGVLLLFALFYLNFYYWRIVDAFYGNTWRTLCITMLAYSAYRWLAGDFSDRASAWLFAVISFAGIAVSSSYLFIACALLLILAAYGFVSKREKTLTVLSWAVLPLVLYACILLSRRSRWMILVAFGFGLYYLWLAMGKKKFLSRAECFFQQYSRLLFFILFPAVLIFYSFYVVQTKPDFLYNYAYFFRNHQDVDMVKDYFFRYAGWLDNGVNILRWLGVILLCLMAKREEEKYMRFNALYMSLVFMNPLCTPAIAGWFASNVFYRAYEVMFNPFTELFLLAYILRFLMKQRILQGIVALFLCGITLISNGLALQGDKNVQYGFYIAAGKGVNPLTKMEPQGVQVIDALRKNIGQKSAIVLSQAEGTRIYLPHVVQLITARDTYYPHTRVDEDLYQIAKRHHPWDEAVLTPYEKTEMLLRKYKVDFVIVRYWENPEFDAQLARVGEMLYQNAEFRLYAIK